MESKDIKMFDSLSTKTMHKSAIIYRDDSACFIYVCFHFTRMFNEINETLRHIESHFQLVNVVVDQFTEDENLVDSFAITSATETVDPVDVMIEVLDANNIEDIFVTTRCELKPEDGKSADSKCSGNGNRIVKEKTKETGSSEEISMGNRLSKRPAAERPYRCHKCPLTCRNMTVLRSHMKNHIDDKLLEINKCKECDVHYKNAYALRINVLGVHLKTKRFTCGACSVQFNFSQSKQFQDHLQQHNGPDNKLWANIRDGIHHRKVNLTKYEVTDSFTEEQFSCEFCTQRFFIKCNLDVHMKSVHSSQRRLQCSECYFIFTTPKYYFAHQLEHQRVGPNIVERDDNVLLANLDAVIDERIIYHGDEFSEHPFRCLICNATFDMNHDIRSHIRRKHVYKMFPPPLEPKKEFICDLCGMLLKSKFAVKKHLLIHTNTKSHCCLFCGKLFRLSSTRKIHERQHTGEKPFQCHECGKAFISKELLTAHKKSHDDTTYPCHICGKAFNLPSGYRNHIKTHREDRSFKCTICEKTFNTRLYLTRRMNIHSDKQYQCRFCESKFNTSDGQRQHQRHKHKNELKSVT